MNSVEFGNKLNVLLGEALKAMERKELEPSCIIGTLNIAATQLTNMFSQMALAKQQAQAPKILLPGTMRPPNGL
jgi:hypothetical protein